MMRANHTSAENKWFDAITGKFRVYVNDDAFLVVEHALTGAKLETLEYPSTALALMDARMIFGVLEKAVFYMRLEAQEQGAEI
jgi:hypothetical protein